MHRWPATLSTAITKFSSEVRGFMRSYMDGPRHQVQSQSWEEHSCQQEEPATNFQMWFDKLFRGI
eukprot:6352547-Amphidinium_carterae.2